MRRVDVAIIGAGPAGLFAANELIGCGLDVLLIDRGMEPSTRTHICFGIGGAGAFSDGKLNLTSKIGGDPASIGQDEAVIQSYIDQVDDTFTAFGAPDKYSGEDQQALAALKQEASRYGIEFISGRQRLIHRNSAIVSDLCRDLDFLEQERNQSLVGFVILG